MLAPILNESRRVYPWHGVLNERGGRAGSEFPQSLTKRLRVPPLPTRRVVVEALGQTPTDSYTVLMGQRRLHLQAEVCFSSPLAPRSLPFLFSWGHNRCVGVLAPILNESRQFYPILLHGSTSLQILPHRPYVLPDDGGTSRTATEDRSGTTVDETDVPSTKESVGQDDSGDDSGKDIGLSYDLLDTCDPPAIYGLWTYLPFTTSEGAVKRIKKETPPTVSIPLSTAPLVKMNAGIPSRSRFARRGDTAPGKRANHPRAERVSSSNLTSQLCLEACFERECGRDRLWRRTGRKRARQTLLVDPSVDQLSKPRGPTAWEILDVGDEVLALACLDADEEQASWERVREVEPYFLKSSWTLK